MASLMPSVYQLAPKKGWMIFRNSDWFRKVENRVLHDKLKVKMPTSKEDNSKPNNPIDIFPPFSEVCGKAFSGRETQNCDIGIREFLEFGSIAGNPITLYNITEMLRKESSYEHAGNLHTEMEDSRFDNLENPGV